MPSTLIEPTTSSASVIRPCAASPAVTANNRMMRRMAGPVTGAAGPEATDKGDRYASEIPERDETERE